MMMLFSRSFHLFMILFVSVVVSYAQVSIDRIVHITCEVEYKYTYQESGMMWGSTAKEGAFSSIFKGAGFLLENYIVTAKHVVIGNSIRGIRKINDVDFSLNGNNMHFSTCKVRISNNSFEPQKIYLSPHKDLAILKLSEEDLELLSLQQLELSQKSLQLEQPVRVWGFPSTVNPQMTENLLITSIKQEWFVLNKPLASGYSGGPVFNSNGKVVGIVSRSEKQQSRIIKIYKHDLHDVLFSKYSDNMVIENNDSPPEGIIHHAKNILWYRSAAQSKNAQATYYLGYCYYYGLGVEQDYVKAARWFKAAAELGHKDAMYEIGYCYYYGLGIDKNFQQAVSWLKKAANAKNIYAMNALGNCYYYGIGTSHSHKNAAIWYNEASLMGLRDAQENLRHIQDNGITQENAPIINAANVNKTDLVLKLGIAYRHGVDGVRKDFREAKRWIYKAAMQNAPQAQCELALMYKDAIACSQNYKEAIYWLEKSSENDFANAQYFLGHIYRGGIGVEKNFQKALAYFQKAAKSKHSDAIIYLGVMLKNAEGVEVNLVKAFNFFVQAAELNNANAMNEVGLCYLNGQGTKVNYAKSMEWFKKSHKNDGYWGASNIALHYLKGLGVKQDNSKAIEWFEKSANLGNVVAMKKLAWIYKQGQITAKNNRKAAYWYYRSLQAGDNTSMENVLGVIAE